jgi:hypothetical protein
MTGGVLNEAALGQNSLHHMRFLDAGQLGVKPAELVREPRVIDPQAMENRRVQVA